MCTVLCIYSPSLHGKSREAGRNHTGMANKMGGGLMYLLSNVCCIPSTVYCLYMIVYIY